MTSVSCKISCLCLVFCFHLFFIPVNVQLRKLISDFAIFTSIMTFVGLDMLMGLKTPKLIVPTEFKVRSDLFLNDYTNITLIHCTSRNLFISAVLTLSCMCVAHPTGSWLDRHAFRKEPVVDLSGQLCPCAAGHHPDLHGSADHCRHRQPERKQTKGALKHLRKSPSSLLL